MNLTSPLTPAQARLIRIHIGLIPVYGWLLLVWTAYAIDINVPGRLDRSGHIKGHDFAHFYVLGQIANDRAAKDLYSFSAQAQRMDALVPQYEKRFLPIHAPQVAVFFAPLAKASYEKAVTLWLLLSAGIYAACCYAFWMSLPSLRRYGWIAAVVTAANPAFYSVITFGQTSAFALLWFTLAWFALRYNRPWLAGLALGSLAYKPTLLLVVPFALLYARDYRVLVAASVAALLQFGAAWAYFGNDAILGYVNNFRAAAEFTSLLEARPELMHSLKSFFSILLPWPVLATAAYVATSAAIGTIAVRTWRMRAPLPLRYAVLLLATVLVNPHVYAYELVVLVPALMLIGSWVIEGRTTSVGVWALLCLSYGLPALGVLTTVTRIQLSVPALAVLLIVVAIAARSKRHDHVGAHG